MNMQEWQPSGKVTAAGVVGTGIFLTILVLNQYVGFFQGNPIDGPLASGLPVFGALVAAYFTKPNGRDVAKVVTE